MIGWLFDRLFRIRWDLPFERDEEDSWPEDWG